MSNPPSALAPQRTERLSRFILTHSEQILSEWEAFARSLFPEEAPGRMELRDHAKAMLTVIAQDLDTPQTKREGLDKAKGLSDSDEKTPDTAAQSHGSGRAESGFTIEEMVSEYRALRASVIRLWTQAREQLDGSDVDDLVRFNEAIDQALAESTSRFSEELGRTKETFLGILSHDLRTPLGAIITSAQFILELDDLTVAHKMASVIVSSGARMNHMVEDLLDFTRIRLGAIPIQRKPLDLGKVIDAAMVEIMAARPGVIVRVEKIGDLNAEWDIGRLQQVLANLIGNAIDHGSAGTPVTIRAVGGAEEVVFSVHNLGRRIEPREISKIFNPLTRATSEARDSNHLGLGLYIAERIVTGHGGTIEVESEDPEGTTFTVRVPRGSRQVA